MQPIIELTYSNTSHQIEKTLEGEIFTAIMRVGVNVDKDRLIKALSDAKAFYYEGYEAGRQDTIAAYERKGTTET